MPEPPPRFDPRRRRAVTFALILVTSLASFESTVVSTAMPTIIGDLDGLPLYSWVFSVYLLGATVSMPLYGRLADLYGRRKTLLSAILLFLFGALVCAFAQSMPQLIAARVLQGLGAGGLVPVALTVTGDLYSLEERARIQGVFSSVWGMASLLGPMLGAFLTVTFGWRSIFSINLPLGIVAFILVSTQLVESRKQIDEEFDTLGAALLSIGVTSLLFAVLQTTGEGAISPLTRVGLIALAAVTLGGFLVRQTRFPHPLVPLALFRDPKTAAPYLAGMILGTTIYGVDTFVPLYVQGARGGSAGAAGAVVTPVVLGWAISAAVAARFMVKGGFRQSARIGSSIILMGFVGLILAVKAEAPVAAISAACALIGLGLGPCSLSQVLAIQSTVAERWRGVATSLVPFTRTLGGAVGVGLLGGVLASGIAQRLGPAAATAGRLLAAHGGGEGAKPVDAVASEALRRALDASLLPVFALLLAVAAVNLLLTARFPGPPSDSLP